MGKLCKNSQILIVSVIAALLFATPFLSASIRSAYHYFIVNILILALGAEAGLLSSTCKPVAAQGKKAVSPSASSKKLNKPTGASKDGAKPDTENNDQSRVTMVKESTLEITRGGIDKVQSCEVSEKHPSSQSIFFIGDGENTAEEEATEDSKRCERRERQNVEEEEEEEEEVGEVSGQELFTKAEAFIGSFYEQLRIQREESWKRIHGSDKREESVF